MRAGLPCHVLQQRLRLSAQPSLTPEKASAMLRILIISILALALPGGCSWVKVSPEAKSVETVEAAEVEDCRKLGQSRVSVRDRVAAIQRSPGKVQEELERLARNEAARLGGNRIVAVTPVSGGARTYAVYDCRPD